MVGACSTTVGVLLAFLLRATTDATHRNGWADNYRRRRRAKTRSSTSVAGTNGSRGSGIYHQSSMNVFQRNRHRVVIFQGAQLGDLSLLARSPAAAASRHPWPYMMPRNYVRAHRISCDESAGCCSARWRLEHAPNVNYPESPLPPPFSSAPPFAWYSRTREFNSHVK